MGCEKVILKNYKTSDSDVNSANKRLPLMVSDAGFGESDRVEIHHIASTQSSLGMNMDNLSSLAHTNICAEFKTGPMLSFPRNMTILHMGSTDNYNIICYMGSDTGI